MIVYLKTARPAQAIAANEAGARGQSQRVNTAGARQMQKQIGNFGRDFCSN